MWIARLGGVCAPLGGGGPPGRDGTDQSRQRAGGSPCLFLYRCGPGIAALVASSPARALCVSESPTAPGTSMPLADQSVDGPVLGRCRAHHPLFAPLPPALSTLPDYVLYHFESLDFRDYSIFTGFWYGSRGAFAV